VDTVLEPKEKKSDDNDWLNSHLDLMNKISSNKK